MGADASQQSDQPFSHEQLVLLVAETRRDLLLRNNFNASSNWFSDRNIDSVIQSIENMTSKAAIPCDGSGSESSVETEDQPDRIRPLGKQVTPLLNHPDLDPAIAAQCSAALVLPDNHGPLSLPSTTSHHDYGAEATWKDGSTLTANIIAPYPVPEEHSPREARSFPRGPSPMARDDTVTTMGTPVTSDSEMDLDVIEIPPGVVIEEHVPGENDFLSGGVATSDAPIEPPFVDPVVFEGISTLDQAVDKLPYKMLRKEQVIRMGILPIQDRASLRRLPHHFVIPILGLHKAAAEIEQRLAIDDEDTADAVIIDALIRRGGLLTGDVLYAEDMRPLVAEWEVGFDREYWQEIQLQGEFWEQMDTIMASAHFRG